MALALLFRILPVVALAAFGGWAGADQPPRANDHPPVVYAGTGDYVVVVHGWAWLRDTMRPTARFLHRQGYNVICVRYDPRSEMPEAVVENRIERALRDHCTDAGRKIHFVGHSMGGLMIRSYLARHRPENLGRTVLLAPPNHGIEAVDRVKDWRLFARVFGEPARLLGTTRDAIPAGLGPADFPLGVLMGRDVGLPLVSVMLPGADDGVVAVESGRLEGMTDFSTVRCGHSRLPSNPTVLAQTLAFLREGRFDPALAAGDAHRAKRTRVPALRRRVRP